jgi:hypothetical protein
MANQPVVDLIVAPCRVVAVKVSSKDDIRPLLEFCVACLMVDKILSKAGWIDTSSGVW